MLWNADIDAGNYNKQCNLQRLSDDLRLVFFLWGDYNKIMIWYGHGVLLRGPDL